MVFTISSVIFFTAAIRKEAQYIFKDAPEMILQRIVAGRHELIPVSYIEKIKSIRGIIDIKPRLWGYYFDPVANANYTIIGKEHFSHGDDEAVIGSALADARNLSEGDRFVLRRYDGKNMMLKIADVLNSDSALVSSDLIVISSHTFRNLFGIREGLATDLSITVRRKEELVTIAKKIVAIYPDTRPILRSEILRTYASVFDWRSGIVLVLIAGSVLAFFIFAWDKATGLSAEEKNEIGILKALGWETSDVIMIKFWEGTIISITSYIVGVILAYLHVFFASSLLFEQALKGWSILYPEFKLIPTVDVYHIILLFFLTVLPYTISTIIPSWRAAITDPDIVMR
ncbi:MAG: FtsX-like permease family protein [Nitrospirae bacterium]|nr:MAG: FtsX-like permease family protein [Nitrospirota bacterium]